METKSLKKHHHQKAAGIIATRGEKAFYAINYVLVTLITLTMVLPLLNIIATSFSSERAIISDEVGLWPVEFTTYTYEQVFRITPILSALKNTVILTVVGTVFSMFCTTCTAYALSKKRLQGRSVFLTVITFTMVINAGMIPNFLLIKDLGLMNTYWAIWLPSAISTYNMIVLKTFFSSLPESLEESALLDGANDLIIFARIALPLSLPSIATITLFTAVGYWNTYMSMILYVSRSDMKVLQQVLYDLLSAVGNFNNQAALDAADAAQQTMATESVRATAIIIATLPIMCVYPFLQKYFTKGVMIGAIKG